MVKYWPVRLGIAIKRMKLKSPHHARYRLTIGLWGIEMIEASKRSVCIIGAKIIPIYIKLARLIVIDIGLGLSSHPWQWYRLTIDSGHEISALHIVLQKNSVGKFSEEFSMYVLQRGETASDWLRRWNKIQRATRSKQSNILTLNQSRCLMSNLTLSAGFCIQDVAIDGHRGLTTMQTLVTCFLKWEWLSLHQRGCWPRRSTRTAIHDFG